MWPSARAVDIVTKDPDTSLQLPDRYISLQFSCGCVIMNASDLLPSANRQSLPELRVGSCIYCLLASEAGL